jgi:hypothetical protein
MPANCSQSPLAPSLAPPSERPARAGLASRPGDLAARVIGGVPFVGAALCLCACALLAAAGRTAQAASFASETGAVSRSGLSVTSSKFSVAGLGISCWITPASAACQVVGSQRTLSATLAPDGALQTCDQPTVAASGCVLWPHAKFPYFGTNSEPKVGPFACIPVGHLTLPFRVTGVLCAVNTTGKGFQIKVGNVAAVSQFGRGPYPPCTHAAVASAVPPHVRFGSLHCAGRYATAIGVARPPGSYDFELLFHAHRHHWVSASRALCGTGRIPTRIWFLPCATD